MRPAPLQAHTETDFVCLRPKVGSLDEKPFTRKSEPRFEIQGSGRELRITRPQIAAPKRIQLYDAAFSFNREAGVQSQGEIAVDAQITLGELEITVGGIDSPYDQERQRQDKQGLSSDTCSRSCVEHPDLNAQS